MLEIKKPMAVTNALVTPKSTTIISGTSASAGGNVKSVPAITPFARKSTSAISIGRGVNPTVSIAPLAQAFLEGSNYYGHQIDKTPQLVVQTNDQSTIRWLVNEFSSAVESDTLVVPVPHTAGPINYFQPEGCALLMAAIKKPCEVLILLLPAIGRKSSLVRNEIVPLLTSAHQRCTTVIVVFQGLSADDASCLPDYFETVLHIEACEPDKGYTSAFTVAPAPGTLLAAVSPTPMIDNIRVNKNGQIERNHYECVSPNAMNREIAVLFNQGKTYTEIAEQYDMDKSTIMRRVVALPLILRGRRS